jgi:hypothetical protein
MPSAMITQYSDPKSLAHEGERIYAEKYKSQYEAQYQGKFVAIDVRSQMAFIGSTPEEALGEARISQPGGLFHLIKVGSAGAFRVSYTSHASSDWLFH